MAERVDAKTILIGLMAYPIRHSSSPTMHNEAYAKLGENYVQMAFEVDNDSLKDAVQSMRALGMRGSNISMPNKTEVIKYLDELSPEAELCGAVNTVVNDNGHLKGYNTDGTGFMAALKDNNIDVIGKKMTIVGAGGAATAVSIQAALDGVKEISIFNIKDAAWERGVNNADKINANTKCKANVYDLADLDKLKEEIEDSFIFVNATGVGMKPMEGQTYIPDKSFLRPDLVVVDVIYAPRETALLKMAKEVGCKTMNGLGMMLFQGDAACRLYTGKSMPIPYMKEVLNIKYD